MRRQISLLFVTIALGLAGCGQKAEKLTQLPPLETANSKNAPPAAKPSVDEQSSANAAFVEATGTAEPLRAADLGPQMTARVSAVLVDEGDVVKAGAPLVRLDMAEAELRLRQTEANAAAAKSQYEQANSEYERLAPLAPQGTVTAQQLSRLAAQRDALKSSAEAASIAASNAQREVSIAMVRAPFGGIISKVSVEVGEVATMMPARILVRLVDLSAVDVRVRVHERDLARFSVGSTASATFPSNGQVVQGKVTFISPEIDPRTRMAEVVTRIPNDEGLLRAGMFAQIRIQSSTPTLGVAL